MGLKDSFQLFVCGPHCGWNNAQVDDAFTQTSNADQTAEIFVPCDEKPFLLTRTGQQISVRRSRKAEFSGSHDIVAEVPKESRSQRVNVLVEQESHEATLKWMSSV
jgi:hypothetical protein